MAKQQANSATVQPALVRHEQHRGQPGGAVKPESASPVRGLVATGAIPGRATPTLLIFSILSLVFFAAWIMRPLGLPHFAIWQWLQLPQMVLLSVPLPPPRLLLQQI